MLTCPECGFEGRSAFFDWTRSGYKCPVCEVLAEGSSPGFA